MLNHQHALARTLQDQGKHGEATSVAEQFARMFPDDQRACHLASDIYMNCSRLSATGKGRQTLPTQEERQRYAQRGGQLLSQAAKARRNRTPDVSPDPNPPASAGTP
ncbi:MAG: hypothetical protein IID44_30080 [Planctomycetes bacterium]|nr:hypothetical protein [Planctomycetota bacterium]